MLNIFGLTKTNKLILAVFAVLAVLALGSGKVHAATLNVSGGCTLPIAIDSVNAGSNQSGCTAVGGYGSNDTISIPAGTTTLTADLPLVTQDVEIKGAGIGSTIIDGDQAYTVFRSNSTTIKISDMKIQAYSVYVLSSVNSDVELSNLDIDGQDAFQPYVNIAIVNNSGSNKTVDLNNIYMHDISYSTSRIIGIGLSEDAGGTTTANLSNITLANIDNPTGSMNGFFVGVGSLTTLGGYGTMNASMANITVDNLTGGNIVAPFGGGGFADGGNATVNLSVNSATITGTRGITGNAFPLVGIKSAAFYSVGAGLSAGDDAVTTINVINSLLADNLTDSTSSNCQTADLTAGFSGAGTATATIISDGYNMSDDSSCSQFTNIGDRQNVNNIVSTLGTLQNNGGVVPTRALLAGSPAVAAGGQVLGVTTDARGVARPSTCPSVGAFQFEGAVCAATTTNANAGSGNMAAPNTGAKTASTLLAVVASILGLSLLSYTFSRKRV